MPRKPPAPRLLGGPYVAPATQEGSLIACRYLGTVTVSHFSVAPIPWPLAKRPGKGGHMMPVLTGSLEQAVKVESAKAVAYHWGVSIATVQRWRKVLGVGRFNAGTKALWKEQVGPKLHKKGYHKRGGKTTARKMRKKP